LGAIWDKRIAMTTPSRYHNFRVAIYARAYEVLEMSNLDWLKQRFDLISRYLKVGKIYLETHRDMVVVDESTLIQAREFLMERGVQVSGGITATVNETNYFQTYCYSNPEHRQKLKDVVTLTARLFDEVILDDFFFTNCKCPLCVAAKGEKSWTNFRLEQMTRASQELVLAPARTANPRVEVVIKYPNWYEHFQGLGFNLEDGPRLFDAIYTGNETRDPVIGTQHLQPYQSYLIFRYFENIKPGRNRGGWVDPSGNCGLDRYAEQLWLTLFAKAPEITLFDFRAMLWRTREENRSPRQGEGPSFDLEAAAGAARKPDEILSSDAIVARTAGAAFDLVDPFVGKLGNPVGLKTYKPYHSSGEDFLPNYLGMLGIPFDLVPEFPVDAPTVLLTESAKFDPRIVDKIEQQLMNGKTVVITSGLLRALLGKGIRNIVELEYTGQKLLARDFLMDLYHVYSASRPILVPKIHYMTNDSWEEISCISGTTGTPLLLFTQYGRSRLYILTIPDNPDDLYALPLEVLTRIKKIVTKDLFVHLESPAQVALFVYDNHTFIVESFLDKDVDVRLVLDERFTQIRDILSGQVFSGDDLLNDAGQKTSKTGYAVSIKPHSFRVFQVQAC
jgi:hypothetical protein